MNKFKQLQKVLIRQTLTCVGIIVAFVAVYFATDYLVDSSAKKKEDANLAYNRDQNEITSLTTQLDKSTVAEKNYSILIQARETNDFSADSDKLKDWLRKAKAQYRLSNALKLSITTAKPSENAEFHNINYNVVEHPAMKLEFSAISDAHVYSFLHDLIKQSSGFVRLDSISMKRNGDIDNAAIAQVRTGGSPYMVDAKIEFDWIGLTEKEVKSTTPATAAAPVKTP